MSNYASWDLYSLGKRLLEWRGRIQRARNANEIRSYAGELAVLEREFNARFFTGPYFPEERL